MENTLHRNSWLGVSVLRYSYLRRDGHFVLSKSYMQTEAYLKVILLVLAVEFRVPMAVGRAQ